MLLGTSDLIRMYGPQSLKPSALLPCPKTHSLGTAPQSPSPTSHSVTPTPYIPVPASDSPSLSELIVAVMLPLSHLPQPPHSSLKPPQLYHSQWLWTCPSHPTAPLTPASDPASHSLSLRRTPTLTLSHAYSLPHLLSPTLTVAVAMPSAAKRSGCSTAWVMEKDSSSLTCATR